MSIVSEERFVGRAGELKTLGELVSGVMSGVGGVALLVGEQGVGKSALLRAGLAGAAPGGCRVGWDTANELGQQIPLRLMAGCLGTEGRLAVEASGGGGV
jgi:AAA ATPase domain